MEKYLVELLFDSLCTSLCIEKRQTVQSRETRSSESKERLFDAEELKESGTNPERIHVVPQTDDDRTGLLKVKCSFRSVQQKLLVPVDS